jgi:hypothetical protein
VKVESARQTLRDAVEAGQPGLENFVIRGPSLAAASVLRFDLTEQMAQMVASDVFAAATALTGKQFLRYDPSYQTSSSQVMVESLSDIPELAAVDHEVRLGDVPLDSDGGQVVAMAHAVGVGPQKVVAYRLKGPGIAARRAKGITLLPRGGIYEPVEGEILYYEPRFDAFTCDGVAFFTSVSLIQTKLHADSKARALAKETLAEVTANVDIAGFEALEAAVMDDPTLRAKMAAVARLIQNDPEYVGYLTTANLVAFVESNSDFQIPVAVVGGTKMLAFDSSPQHRHQIPRLLADDYLHSLLTDRNYEAGSKHQASS